MQRGRDLTRNSSGQQARGRARDNIWTELETLRQDLNQLHDLLNRERAHCNEEKEERMRIVTELEETKKELAKQKNLKEMHINKGKEIKKDLERLQKYSTDEALSATKIAEQVRNTNRQKKKKDLHADYEELQVAHLISTEKFAAELQGEKEKNRLLQEELDQIKVSQQELSLKYETDILGARQLAESLQCELLQQTQAHTEKVSQDQQIILTLRAEQDTLRQQMAEEVAVLQQNTLEKERMLWTELEELKTQLRLQRNDTLSKELQADREEVMPSKRTGESREEQPEEQMGLEENLPGASAPEAAEEAGVSLANVSEMEKRPSIWKRARHFLGLRKPQRWKNK